MNIIAIDLGATNTRIALVDGRSGAVMQRHKIASTRSEYETSVQKIAHAVSGFPKAPIGIAVAGQLNEQRTIVKHAPNLDWHHVSLAEDLAKLTKRDVTLENDVRAAALGELRYGGLRDTKTTGLLVFWGSGIGGAVTHAGELVRGAHNLAGEIGHVPYSTKGPRCACGKRGCYEAYAGGHVLDRAARKLGLPNAAALPKERLGKATAITAQLIGCLAVALDPERIVLGGGLGLAHFNALASMVQGHKLPVHPGKLDVRKTPLGDDAGLLGAAAGAYLAKTSRKKRVD